MTESTVRIPASELRHFADSVLSAIGLAPDDARVAAECLVSANLRGVDSHGVLRLIQYRATADADEVNPAPDVRVIEERGATALVDADGGYGFRPCLLAAETSVALARKHGIGIAGVRNSHHFGMGATYVLPAAEAALIGLLTTTSYPVLPPPGGTQPVVGNNPIACAVPRRSNRAIVLDMALSQVAFGQIRLAAHEGREIPLGWAYDESGRETTDAQAALAAKILVPTGGYKGYGLAVIGEILAGILTSSPFGVDSDAHGKRDGGVGHVVLAIDPGFFLDPERFLDGVERLVDQIKAVRLAEGHETVYLPGEIEWATENERLRHGIPISAELWEQLTTLAAEFGITAPDSA